MAALHQWLLDQEQGDIPGNFLCNWELTLDAHRKRKLLVYVDGELNMAVAYQWGSLLRPGILQVRSDMQGRGIGRALVNRRLAEAHKNGTGLLRIECQPSSSIAFWQRMGFTVKPDSQGRNFAYRTLPHALQVPPSGEDLIVTVRLFPEARKWDEGTSPALVVSAEARVGEEGALYLRERIYLPTCFCGIERDALVEIFAGNQLLYRDKAKYEQARRLGVRECPNGFYLDSIAAQ